MYPASHPPDGERKFSPVLGVYVVGIWKFRNGCAGEVTSKDVTVEDARSPGRGMARNWDVSIGKETQEVFQGNADDCAAVCGENRMTVVGLGETMLNVFYCETKHVLSKTSRRTNGESIAFHFVRTALVWLQDQRKERFVYGAFELGQKSAML